MVAISESKGVEADDLYEFRALAVLPISKDEPLTLRFHGYISKERMAKIVAALQIIMDQKPGAVVIKDNTGDTQFTHVSTKES